MLDTKYIYLQACYSLMKLFTFKNGLMGVFANSFEE